MERFYLLQETVTKNEKENYMKWIREKLLPKVEIQSVLVIDNASFHNTEVEKAPTSNSKKREMMQWLIRKGDSLFRHHAETAALQTH